MERGGPQIANQANKLQKEALIDCQLSRRRRMCHIGEGGENCQTVDYCAGNVSITRDWRNREMTRI